MDVFNVKGMREELCRMIDEVRAIRSAGDESNEANEKVAKIRSAIESTNNKIKEAEDLARVEASVRSVTEDFERANSKSDNDALATRAFYKSKVFGSQLTNDEQRALKAAQASSTSAFLPTTLSDVFSEALKNNAGVIEAGCEVRNTLTGEPLVIPVLNDVANNGAQVSEGSNGTALAVDDTSKVTLYAWQYDSKYVDIPRTYERDIIGLQGWLPSLLSKRVARAFNSDLTIGNGSSKPLGCAYSPTTGKTFTSTTAFTAAELIQLMFSVDAIYRTRSTAKFMMNSSVLSVVMTLADSNGNLVYNQGDISKGLPLTVYGYGVVENPFMPAATAGLKPILFGDFYEYYVARIVGSPDLISDAPSATSRLVRSNLWFDGDGSVKVSTAVKAGVMASS